VLPHRVGLQLILTFEVYQEVLRSVYYLLLVVTFK